MDSEGFFGFERFSDEVSAIKLAIFGAKRMIALAIEDLTVLHDSARSTNEQHLFHFRSRYVEGALKNNFGIDMMGERTQLERRLHRLLIRYILLAEGFEKPFRKLRAPGIAADGDAGAIILQNAIAFAPSFVTKDLIDQSALLVHEIFHLRMQTHTSEHHPGVGHQIVRHEIPHTTKAHIYYPEKDFYNKAIANPWSYQWFCLACSHYYYPAKYGVSSGLGGKITA